MGNPEQFSIVWSAYMKYRSELRGFEFAKIEKIIRYSGERYFDTATRRMVVVGRHDERLVMIPYDEKQNEVVPITIHATNRQQINFRLKTGRFIHD